MKKRIMALFLVFMICAAALALFGCADAEDGRTPVQSGENCNIVIRAEVVKISGGKIYIRGLTEGFTSDYVFDEAGVILCREGEEDIRAELEIGDIITVTFSGISTKDNPGTMQGVTKVVKMKSE
ncbi:MAG: hypothetical protein IJ021_08745 [Clostridia bacterium]|nr:hypothetical protein [Clostridia bacterium]